MRLGEKSLPIYTTAIGNGGPDATAHNMLHIDYIIPAIAAGLSMSISGYDMPPARLVHWLEFAARRHRLCHTRALHDQRPQAGMKQPNRVPCGRPLNHHEPLCHAATHPVRSERSELRDGTSTRNSAHNPGQRPCTCRTADEKCSKRISPAPWPMEMT